jgi:Transcription termination factor nusG
MPSWYAIHTEPSCEFAARRALETLRVRVFLPWCWQRRLVGHRRTTVKAAWFARYLFADLQGYPPIREILSARGVASLLGETPIPERIMAMLIGTARPDGEMPKPELKPGDEVLVAALGQLAKIESLDEKHIRVIIPLFGVPRYAKIPRASLDC